MNTERQEILSPPEMETNCAKAGYWQNAQGHLVPASKVRAQDKLENELVESLFEEAKAFNEGLASFRGRAMQQVEQFIDLLRQEYGAKKGGAKGNVTLMSYDGLQRMQISVSQFITFGPELEVAKNLIDECIHSWGVGSDENIQALVEHAFRVDKKGAVSVSNILSLRRLEIKDTKWQSAMKAISDSIRSQGSKSYVRFYKRETVEAEWQAITLDIART